ncbi:AAA family ATPase [Rhizobium leguminosarum]|uniref:ATP-binding protein n=1 Tax=Rhizobium ruizarguesonis TaxID=2081791 RepID=UPI001A992EDB|nr:ATP-binding protein [Rhizobium ruizarguesonis]MBY5890692.1 AAA family ATPase [Rhizobium leguminosarum]QSY99594.1 AAA family ATPase [Rhizobium ruizarguesonis]
MLSVPTPSDQTIEMLGEIMVPLEEYLQSDYLVHCQDMSTLTAAISEAISLLRLSNTNNGWPYECKSSEAVDIPQTVSHGTTAMVLTAIGRATGFCSTTSGTRARLISDKSIDDLLLKNVLRLSESMQKEAKEGKIVPTSSTFGEGNPLTLSHIVDLLASLKPDRVLVDLGASKKADIAKNLENIETSIHAARTRLDGMISDTLSQHQTQLLERERSRYYRNAFVPMRAVRAAIGFAALGKLDDLNKRLPLLRNFFEVMLHEQLSFSAIPDSRFDAAELVFSLEGLVLCAREAVDEKLFYRVLEVLGEKQNTSAHWRPSKPFLAAKTGEIFLPLSVEVANSLMRSIAIMDSGRFHDTYTSKGAPLLKRFWSWLQARAVRLQIAGEDCLGWHSEHINSPEVVHPWDTSLVVEFMINYHELLDREIQNTTLILSGLQWKYMPSLAGAKKYSNWSEVIEEMDPSIGGEQKSQVYRRIGEDFVQGWADEKPNNFSMMLYGPPGTGKTSVADKLCEYLGMRQITVTVSDFLGDGGANVESRAKAIFQTLTHQRRAVILFDEIDSFLLDRDSEFYKKQDSLFQFLTPGMLPKFNNLRAAERCIFIVATNYDNRIDPAIKRTGRIDKRYLLPLPDSKRRELTLGKFGLAQGAFSTELKKASVLFGFGDLKNAARSEKGDPSQIIESLKDAAKATSFKSYLRRLKNDAADFPVEEFADLLRLAEDAGGCLELEKLAEAELGLLDNDYSDLKVRLNGLRGKTDG